MPYHEVISRDFVESDQLVCTFDNFLLLGANNLEYINFLVSLYSFPFFFFLNVKGNSILISAKRLCWSHITIQKATQSKPIKCLIFYLIRL